MLQQLKVATVTFKHKFVHIPCTFKQKFVRTQCTFKHFLKRIQIYCAVRRVCVHLPCVGSLDWSDTCGFHNVLHSHRGHCCSHKSKGKHRLPVQVFAKAQNILAVDEIPDPQRPEGSSKTRSFSQCIGAAITPSYEPTPDDQNVRWAHPTIWSWHNQRSTFIDKLSIIVYKIRKQNVKQSLTKNQ